MSRNDTATPASAEVIDQVQDPLAPATTALATRGQGMTLAKLHPLQEGETPLAYVARMMQLLPEPDEDAVNKIAAGILAADDLDDENQLWDSTGSSKLIGKTYVFQRLTVRPSDFDNAPLPFFLVCMATDYETGQETVITTGSVNIVTSLIKAHLLGNLPAVAEICGPRRRPKSGYIPLHLRWMVKMAVAEANI